MLGLEPRAAGWAASMLHLCNAATLEPFLLEMVSEARTGDFQFTTIGGSPPRALQSNDEHFRIVCFDAIRWEGEQWSNRLEPTQLTPPISIRFVFKLWNEALCIMTQYQMPSINQGVPDANFRVRIQFDIFGRPLQWRWRRWRWRTKCSIKWKFLRCCCCRRVGVGADLDRLDLD